MSTSTRLETLRARHYYWRKRQILWEQTIFELAAWPLHRLPLAARRSPLGVTLQYLQLDINCALSCHRVPQSLKDAYCHATNTLKLLEHQVEALVAREQET